MAALEELVKQLEQVESAWGLADKVPALKAGLADLMRRVRALEADVKVIKSNFKI